MADESYRRTYQAFEFVGLGGGSVAENKAIIDAALQSFAPPLSKPVNETRVSLGGAALIVEWTSLPLQADIDRVNALIPTIVGVATTAQPIEVEALAVADNATTVLADVIDITTPPRDAGTYQIVAACQLGMLATVANAGVRAIWTFSRIRGADVVSRPYEDNWDLQQLHMFAAAITFTCLAGDRIRARLQFARIGVAATARVSQARVTIDQLAPAGQ